MNRKERKAFVKKRCAYCFSNHNLTIDHKIPLIQGGTDKDTNLQCLCMGCNGTKGGLSDKQIKRLARWLYAINQEREAKGKKPFAIKKLPKSTAKVV